MKILFYGINYAPELTGIGKYSGELCEWLAAQGHEVRVVTAPPYYPAWRVAPGYHAWRFRFENRAGVKVFRCPLWVPGTQGGRNRILHLISFMLSSAPLTLLLALFWRPDLVLAIEPPIFCAFPAWLAARSSGGTAWLHIQDLEIDAAVGADLVSESPLLDLVFLVERWLLRHFDRVSTISRPMLQRLLEKRLPASRSFLFPNWVDTETLTPLPGASPMRAELGIAPDQVVALYSGNMGRKQGLEVLVEAARLLTGNRQIVLVLCGDGSMRQELELAAADLANIVMLPLQPVERLNELLNLADLHLLPQQPGMDDLVMPSKLLGMLASARPIIGCVSREGDLARVIAAAGLVVAPGQAEELTQAIVQLAASPSWRAELGRRGRELCSAAWEKELVLRRFQDELLRQRRGQ